MRSFSVFVICFILAVLGILCFGELKTFQNLLPSSLNRNRYVYIFLGPLKTSGAVSINENGGSKSLTENNEGSAVVQPSKAIVNCIYTAWAINFSLLLIWRLRNGSFSNQERRI